MPTVSEMYPSLYVSGSDLKGRSFTMKIASFRKEEVFDKEKNAKVQKVVLYFADAKKGVLLGKTQATEIAEALGDDEMNNWTGKAIEIYPTNVKAFGKVFLTVRFRKATTATVAPPPEALNQEGVEEDEPEHIDPDNPLNIK